MKGPYPKGKGKGKVHPSPGPSASSGSGEVSSALKVLPGDILAQTAALGEKDREVLAYLITRSMKCHVAPRAAASHRPTIGCGCFECYKSFWSRWNSSVDKGVIDRAIDAFEEHLARVEKEKNGNRDGKRKGRKGNGNGNGNDLPEKKVLDEEPSEAAAEEKEKVPEEEEEPAEVSGESKEGAGTPAEEEGEETEKVLEEEGGEGAVSGGGGERKKGWMDLMGIFNFRLFGA